MTIKNPYRKNAKHSRQKTTSNIYSYKEIYSPRFSGEYIQLPSNNHTLTEFFTFEQLPIQKISPITNDELSPELSGKQYFVYPLNRLAFDFSVIKIYGLRGSDFPSYIVDQNSEDRDRITYYQGKVNDQKEVKDFLEHLAHFEFDEARELLKKNYKLIPFIGVLEGCDGIALQEGEKSLNGKVVCPSEIGPLMKYFSLFIAKDTLFFVWEWLPESPLPQKFDESCFISGTFDSF